MRLAFLSLALISFLSFVSIAQAQWVHTNLPNDSDVGVTSIAAIGSDLFAATIDGVFFSTDSGVTWSAAPDGGLGSLYVYSLEPVGTNLFAGTDSGVFRSTDNGINWTLENGGLPNIRVFALAATGTNLFAATQSIASGGDGQNLFVSTDDGSTWALADSGFPNPVGILSLACNGNNIFAGGGTGVFLSTNNGANWTTIGLTEVLSVAVSGTNLIFGSASGVGVLADNGDRWISDGLTSKDVYAIAVSGTNLFAGIYNYGNSSEGSVFLSTDSGASWLDAGLPDRWVYTLTIIDSNLFAGTEDGIWRRPLSEMTGAEEVGLQPFDEQHVSAYPNPCSQSVTMSFSCANSGEGEVTIVNMLGEEVARIFDGELSATADGKHSFSWDASRAALGVYECVVSINGNFQRIPFAVVR